jgi:uncharacterized protein
MMSMLVRRVVGPIALSSVFAFAMPVPTHQGYLTVLDPSVLSDSERTQIERTLREYNARTTNEFAVLVIPTLGDEVLEPYANRIFHEWGIGIKGKDNGVLFLWATKEHKIRIEVGRGLEPYLPDGRAGQIIREDIAPHFRKQEWYAGVTEGVSAIITQLDRAQPPSSLDDRPATPSKPFNFLLVTLLLSIGIISVAVFAFIAAKRKREREEAESAARAARYSSSIPPERVSHYRTFNPPSRSYSSPPPRRSTPSVAVVPDTDSYSSRRRDSDSSSSDSSSSSSSDSSVSFGGGDSGGGGASGDY